MQLTISVKKIVEDIRFWILLFFIIRLFGITNPPLEVGHNWRQTTVAMIARNFHEIDANIFYPRIDIAGELTGITGMEFPLLNYLIYIAFKIFGYQHWYGRLINLFISSFGLWFFYKLSKKYFTRQVAFYATIILAASIWFQFSRKMMPDTFAMSFIIASIYFGTNYFETNLPQKKYLNLSGYVLLMMLGVLSKLPSGYLLVVFGLFVFNKQISIRERLIFVFASSLGLIPVFIWYFYWVPYLVENFGFWHYSMGRNLEQGVREIIQNIPDTLSKFYDTALKYIGFAAFLFGLVYSIIKREKTVLLLFILSFFSFCVIIFKAGFYFPLHNYYVIPFVPVMALIAGYGLTKIANSKIAIVLLIAISIEGIANQQHDFRIKEKDLYLLNLETELDKISQRDDLIIINSSNYPTPMYFAHRKGWVNSNEMIQDSSYINELMDKGLKYILILKSSFGTEIELEQFESVLETKDYCIYKAKTIANRPI
jgi:4-amino-4-deoxy-L-arabinose transferase-like glycosyltransferase